jgi:hypothetical protein
MKEIVRTESAPAPFQGAPFERRASSSFSNVGISRQCVCRMERPRNVPIPPSFAFNWPDKKGKPKPYLLATEREKRWALQDSNL